MSDPRDLIEADVDVTDPVRTVSLLDRPGYRCGVGDLEACPLLKKHNLPALKQKVDGNMDALTGLVSAGSLVALSLLIGALTPAAVGAAEPDALVNLAFGCPVAVKTPTRPETAGKPAFAASDLLKGRFADDTGKLVGWGRKDPPFVYVNTGTREVSLLKGAIKVPPRAVCLHPGPDTDVVVGWQSPVTGTVSVRAKITHGHKGGSDGVTWSVNHGTSVLANGRVAPSGSAQVPAEPGKDANKLAAVSVARGDTLALVTGRGGGHSGDTTFIELVITETSGAKRVWDLARDVVDDIRAGNPHADSLGNAGVWHFLAMKSAALPGGEDALATYPWSPEQLVDGVRAVGGYSCDPAYKGPEVDEWVEIDLGADQAFSEVRVYPVWAHSRKGEGAANFPLDYTISTKADGGRYVTVKTVTNQVNPGIAPVVLPVPNQKARWVKIAVSRVTEPPPGETNYALRLAEVEVLGRGAPQRAAETPGPAPTRQHWSLQTDDTAMTVAVVDNRPAIWEWKSPRAGWNWLAAPAVIPLPTRVNVSKTRDHTAVTWAFQEATVDTAKGKKLTLRFACNEEPKVQMKFIWWAAEGPGPVQYQEAVENGTGGTVVLWPQRDYLNLGVKPEREVVLWRFHKDAGAPAVRKALFLDRLVDGAAHEAPILAGGQGRGYGFIPFVALDGGAHGVYFAGEWQDGTISVEAAGARPVTARVKHLVRMAHTDVPGPRAELPAVYLGAYAGDMDDCGNGFKRWFFLHKAPENMRKDPTEPWAQWGAFWQDKYDGKWWSEENAFARGMKERLSDTGFESVDIDFGWWAKDRWLGNPVLWPDGMEAAGKLAHENGIKLTLYFPGCGNNLDWGRKLSEMMKRYGVDTYRSDMGAPYGPGGIAMLDWLMANHPNFRWENCQCGGAYKDFAAMRRASVIFGIDVYDPLSNRKMFQVSSYCIHPAQLQAPVRFSMLTGNKAGRGDWGLGEVYDLRSALMGAVFLWAGFSRPSDMPSCMPMLKENIGLYKTRLRPLIREGNLYHLFLRPDGVNWDGLQYHNPLNRKGAVMLFKPACPLDTRRIVLKGLDRSKIYALTFQDRPEQNARKTGAELMDQGFDVTMKGEMVSEIIWIDEAR